MHHAASGTFEKSNFLWKSPGTGKLLIESKKFARSDSPVLILGESGTGKELLAEYIHFHSRRPTGPFIRVNCAAFPSDLIESELFGSIQGAYTDSIKDRTGFFEQADGGSILLDEIAELSLPVQAKLLRVLQDGFLQKVGESFQTKVDVRIIAATNVDLKNVMRKSRFRKDLYYRLAVFVLEIPPLRDRPEDIEVFLQHFLKLQHEKNPDIPSEFSIEALGLLLTYSWPGNVRELQNVIERTVISSQGKSIITPDDLIIEEKNVVDYSGRVFKDSVTVFKKNLIRESLKLHGGNRTRTARALGIQRTYLSRMLKELSITEEKRNDK